MRKTAITMFGLTLMAGSASASQGTQQLDDALHNLTTNMPQCQLRLKTPDVGGNATCRQIIEATFMRIVAGPVITRRFDARNVTPQSFPSKKIDNATYGSRYQVYGDRRVENCLAGYNPGGDTDMGDGGAARVKNTQLTIDCLNEMVDNRDTLLAELEARDKERNAK